MVEKAENSKDWWTKRYLSKDPLYGGSPSAFVIENIALLEGKRILDAGCGEGANAVYLAKARAQVDAIDFAEPAIERAKKLAAEKSAAVTFKCQDLDFFLPELMAYDGVIIVDFHPALQFLKNIARGLKKDGVLLIEAHLTEQLNFQKQVTKIEGLEFFECFKPNEILKNLQGYKILFYDERPKKGIHKIFCIAQKQSVI